MSDNLHQGANPRLFGYARVNRQISTEAEAILWQCLRNRKLKGCKFRRQHPIADYIADFYCFERGLVIEVDGEYHMDKEQMAYDEQRTNRLNELKIKVIRFTNREVMEKLDFVLKEIKRHLVDAPHPRPFS
ncbi:DUF559 domain-containing protein [Fulvivirgaceae bacterium PWU4]|uniref:DUF559 domain-containing protein n=1 Tax=Chryseosolibacter histidini TaxID=2782349 RepID=A0AAP2GIF3_9BACT|nr:endonuclease domain-containing protein [Chryseosolibacter histidini]MBT1696999.1 DUF559 domain-containing protein [Chryseosolibacter histidini]